MIIKKCPYCGSEARVVFVKFSSLYAVQCSHCVNKGFYAQTAESAVNNWNERAEVQEIIFSFGKF